MIFITSTGQLKAVLLLVCACSYAAVGEIQFDYDESVPLGPGWHPAPGQRVPYGMIDRPDHGYGSLTQRANIYIYGARF